MNYYVNPFHLIRPLADQRIDQGVDFSGTGTILAAGNGKVLSTTSSDSGWPGGGWMTYQLTDGPLKGQIIYVAEEITPAVHAGQTVRAGEPIAHLHGYMETGWAANSVRTLSQTPGAGNISGANLPGGGANPTAVGKNFDEFLASLGVPRAPNFNRPVGGKMPSSLQGQSNMPGQQAPGTGGASTLTPYSSAIDTIPGFGWIGSVVSGFSGTATGVADVATTIGGFVTDFSHLVKWISWLFQPANWVRIFAGIGGGILLMVGSIVLVWAAM